MPKPITTAPAEDKVRRCSTCNLEVSADDLYCGRCAKQLPPPPPDPRFADLSDPVIWFAQAMEFKLKANSHKRGWDHCTLGYLRRRVSDELGELRRRLDKCPPPNASNDELDSWADNCIKEAADVANFVMMIADRVDHKRRTRQGLPKRATGTPSPLRRD